MYRFLSCLCSVGALLAGGLMAVWAAGPALGAGAVREVDIVARQLPFNPQDSRASRNGRLQFLGALDLRAADRRFGGISGMIWEAQCRRLLAVTDSGSWIVLEPVEEGDRLQDVRSGWIAPILDSNGNAPISKTAADAEEVARRADGAIFVSYEQTHRLKQFEGLSACDPETLAKLPVAKHEPAEIARWPWNGGVEAMAAMGDGMLLLSETVPAGEGRRQGVYWLPDAPAQMFSLPVPEGYQPTAMDDYTDGEGQVHLLVLHRRASLMDGLSAVVTETLLDGAIGQMAQSREVGRLRPPLTVDNLEALAVRQEGGRVFVYLASDDNFNRLQKTLLLKFELLPEGR